LYCKVKSANQGASNNANPLSLNSVVPAPITHKYCINEYAAIGGQDNENDENFRRRLIKGANILSRGTLAFYEQLFMKINNRILRIFHLGIDVDYKIIIGIVCVDGGNLNDSELNDLMKKSEQFLSISEYKPNGNLGSYGFKLKNMEFQLLDFDFRVQINTSGITDVVRKNIQISLNKAIDYRFWNSTKVQWDDMLQIVKDVDFVDYVPDEYFQINSQKYDIIIPNKLLPRIRGFKMRDIDGNIIIDLSGLLNPIYFQNMPDTLFQQTIG
jgi:hypothetical protein